MSVRRVMGSESEFGLTSPGMTDSSHTYLSAVLVSAFADAEEDRAYAEGRSGFLPSGGWDYSTERPLRDARGFTVARSQAHPSQLTDAPVVVEDGELTAEQIAAEQIAAESDARSPRSARSSRATKPLARRGRDELVTNIVLTNGARFYVDHAHPEYSSPEVITPQEMVAWDLAGDLVAAEAARQAEQAGMVHIDLFKNNTDSKSSSYGTHENYLVDRAVPFERIADELTAFFVTRQVLCGAGRVGIGVPGTRVEPRPGFQISQRADFFEERVGLETTLRRPIINARDEPHSDETRFRRLHVIIGDANLAPASVLIRFGATSLVLKLIEEGLAPQIRLEDPVEALQTVSHDLPDNAPSTEAALAGAFRAALPLEDGTTMTALEVQRRYLEAAQAAYAGADAETDEVLELWDRMLTGLAESPLSLAGEIDWIQKFRLADAIRRRDGLDWSDAKLHALDLQYALLDPARGLGLRLRASGALSDAGVSAASIAEAVTEPPRTTRAFSRGRAVRDFASDLTSASWDTLAFALSGRTAPARISLNDPLRGAAEFYERITPQTAEELARGLAAEFSSTDHRSTERTS